MCILYINLDQNNSYEELPPKRIKTYGRMDPPTSITHMQQSAAQTCRQDTFPLITSILDALVSIKEPSNVFITPTKNED